MQKKINKIWGAIWKKNKNSMLNIHLKHRLFVEGYPIFKKYIPKNMQNIIELGAGSGRYGIKFAIDFPDSNVVISDISEDSLALIKKLTHESGVNNIEIRKEDIFKLSFPDDHFDVVFSDAVIQHIQNPQDAIFEMVRILKPGGRLIISTMNIWNFPHTMYKFISGKKYPYGYEKSYTKKELRKLLKRDNMKIIGEDGFYFAYGIYRLKYLFPFFKLLGKICNRIVKIIDTISNRFISRYFGFEIFIVGEKIS